MTLRKAVGRGLVVLLAGAVVTGVTLHTRPGAEWARQAARIVDIVPVDDFDTRLDRELGQLLYPEMRPLMQALVIEMVAENARAVRLEILRDASLQGWQVPLPSLAYEERASLPQRIALGRMPGDGAPPRLETGAAADTGAGWGLTLLVLAAGLVTMIARRR